MPTLQFKGKNIIWNHHLSVPYHTLEEVPELHFQPEKDNGNLIIEGDNLIALKALLPEYAGKVKCIYIDPPYNTGNEGWVYNDKVNSPLINNWLGKTVGADDLTRHDKWLCMMTPRLKMLRDLLSDDGAIYISIEDNEVANLKLLMDEIFGVENFISIIPWKGKGGGADNKFLMIAHEYILLYGKFKESFIIGEEEKENESFPKLDKLKNQNYKTQLLRKWGANSRREDRPNLYYPIISPDGKEFYPILPNGNDGCWRWSQIRMNNAIENGLVEFLKNDDKWVAYEKIYKPIDGLNTKKYSTWFDNVSNNAEGSKLLKNIFDEKVFDFPKPVELLKTLMKISKLEDEDIILDSFAGSGTTMHAVNELNKEDGGNRKCILVQMKEDSETQPDKNICQNITRERNKLAIEKLGYESGFKYLKVGTAIDPEKMLEGQLPTYEQFAKYIYYLGTGEHLADAKNINPVNHFVGTHGAKAFFLIYEQDVETLTRLALNLSIAEDIVKHSPNKRRVIYAPACFLDSDYMDEKQIEFVSIPYNLFERQTQ
jgi:adenine-specific DNA-methyltransferase